MKKTALVTGINRGIGKEFVKQLLNHGYTVIGTCRNVAEVLPQENLIVEPLDICDDKAIQALAKKYQDTSIDLLINNAGVLYVGNQKCWGEEKKEIGNFCRKETMQTIEINAVSAIKVTEAFVSHILKSNEKLIVTLSSAVGSIAENVTGGSIAYRMSKTALNMGMQKFAIKLKDQGVHVSLLHPGWVQTSMGGPNATVPVDKSVRGMLKIIENKDQFPSGGFYDYEGNTCPF